MLRARLGLLLLTLLLAGCHAPARDARGMHDEMQVADKDPCDPTNATRINQQVPIIPALRGAALGVARNVTRALGDPIVSETPTEDGNDFTRWATGNGTIQVRRDAYVGIDEWSVTYNAPPSDRFTERSANALATALGATGLVAGPDNAPTYGTLRQRLGGGFIDYLQGLGPQYGSWGGITVSQIRDLGRTEPAIANTTAEATAIAYDRCVMDRNGLTVDKGYERFGNAQSDLTAWGDSLVWRVQLTYKDPEPSHCGRTQLVAVDAVTGAVIGPIPFLCD